MHKKFLLCLFIFSFILRAIFFESVLKQGENSWIVFDSAQYHEVAQKIATQNSISQKDNLPNFYRLPGYPIFLGFLYKTFNMNITKTLWVQVFISSILPILIFFLALTLFPEHVLLAKSTAFLASINLSFVMYSGMIATEIPFLIFFLLFLILFIAQLNTHSYSRKFYTKLLCAGLFLGIASLIRPVGLYILALAAFMLIWNIYSHAQNKLCIFLKNFGTLCSGWLIIVLPWLIRNFILTGYIFFHTLPGLHFLQYTATQAYMNIHSCSYLQAREHLLKEWSAQITSQETKTQKPLNDYQRCQIAENITTQYIKKCPLIVLKHATIQMLKTIFALHASHLLYIENGWPKYTENTTLLDKIKTYISPHVSSPFLTGLIYFDILSLLFLLVGFILFLIQAIFRKNLLIIALKTVPFMGLFVFLTLAYGNARLRMPIEPLLIILALTGWDNIFAFYTRKTL